MDKWGAEREELRGDLISFGKVISSRTFKKKSPPFHYEISDVVLGYATYNESGNIVYGSYFNKYIVLEAPRGFAKSELIAGFLPLHHCCYEEGDKYVIIQSKALKEAIKRLRTIKNVLNYSGEFKTLYGDWDESKAITWNEVKITIRSVNKCSGKIEEWTIEAKGTGQQIRGAKEGNQRVSLLILDDPEDELNTKTEDAMEANFDAFLPALPGLDVDKGRCIVIGTPIHQLCIVEKLMKMVGWVKKRYRGVDEINKTSIWEEMKSYETAIAEKAALASVHKLSKWYADTQCEITGNEDQQFKEEDLKYWDGWIEVNKYNEGILHITQLGIYDKPTRTTKIEELTEPKVIPVNIFVGIDPASSKKMKADFSVTMPIAYDNDGNIYVLDYFEDRVSPMVHANQIVETFLRLRPKRAQVEAQAYQEMLREYLHKTMREKKVSVPGLETKWTRSDDKDGILATLEEFTVSHRLHLKPSHHTLLAELVLFPRGRKNCLDALWYATRRLIKPNHTLKVNKVKAFFYPREKKEETTWMGNC
jgi:hypothetical protein